MIIRRVVRSSDLAWIALGVGVLSYDVLCKDGDTMSEAADRYMLRHPWLVRAVALAVAGHVINLVPDKWDVVHQLFVTTRRLKHKTPLGGVIN